MKKILIGHLLVIGTLFLWRADHKAVKPPLKVTTHTVIKPEPKPIVAAPTPTKPKPTPVAKATPSPAQKPPQKKVEAKKPAPPVIKKEPPSNTKLMALMEESLSQLNSKPSKPQATSKPSSIGPLKSETIRYTEKLISALQTMLTFPETQDVTVKLKLSKAGRVLACDVIESQSSINQDYVCSVIPSLQLPPFDGELKGAATHTFSIRLVAEKTN